MRSTLKMRYFLLVPFAFAVLLAGPQHASAQTHAAAASVQLYADVSSAPARITLRWPTFASATGYTIFRRLKGATSWGSSIATLGASAVEYADNSVTVGVYYEYKISRTSSLGAAYAADLPGTGYIAAGIEVALPDYRGKLILLVDDTVAGSLTAEIQTLVADLEGDGWSVLRHDVSRSATVTSIRSMLQADWASGAANVQGLYILGHVPVPYSGEISPAGHFPDHYGAWAADTYYAELNGEWTDETVNNSGGSRAQTRNVPGDGKWDQSDVPTAVELQTGRVDFYDMPAFALSEIELLRSYLNRAHQFKTAVWQPLANGLVSDNLDWTDAGIAASGYRSIAALVGPSHLTNDSGTPFGTLIGSNSYLFAYAGAGGSYTAAAVSTDALATSFENQAVFNMSLGSYFGDWDNQNNLLRAYIGRGRALVSVWSGLPNWWFHHMGMGDPVGYSALVTQSNTSSNYTPTHNGWQSPNSLGKVHLALMGDPSLRLKMIAPPTNVATSDSGGYLRVTWTAATGSPSGYHVYAFNDATGEVTRLTSSPVTGTTYTSTTVPYTNGRRYMVRAVKLEVGASGTYYNQSLGPIATNGGPSSMVDAGMPPVDMGSVVDMSVPPTDMSVPPTDSGTPGSDLGVPTDSSIPTTDGGTPPSTPMVALTSSCNVTHAGSTGAGFVVLCFAMIGLALGRRRRRAS